MRGLIFLSCCAAVLLSAPASAISHYYRADFRFARADTDSATFAKDSEKCLNNTASHIPGPGTFMTYSNAQRANFGGGDGTYYHPGRYYLCMFRKGYRADPDATFHTRFHYRS